MPSSEPESPPVRLTRGWWIGLSAGLILMTGWCLLNVAVDPTGEFGQSGRYAFNRFPPPAVIAAGEAGNNPAFFTRAIREHRGDTFLIGASRTWRGFDTCARQDILRVAGSAWGVREMAQVEQTILTTRRAPATLLIEVGVPTTERPAITDPVQAALSTALSPRTTLFSLQTVAHSLGGPADTPADYPPCEPRASGPADWTQAERSMRYSMGLFDTSAAALDQGQRNLRTMAEQADELCRRTGVRHRLVFFSLPAMPVGAPASDAAMRANTVRIGQQFAHRPSVSGGCDIRHVDLSRTPPGGAALWRNRDHWSDYTHFRPHLGALALDALSREMDGDRPPA